MCAESLNLEATLAPFPSAAMRFVGHRLSNEAASAGRLLGGVV
jgi:hypothetical protein